MPRDKILEATRDAHGRQRSTLTRHTPVDTESTWFSRDLPVFDAVVTAFTAAPGAARPTVRELATATGLGTADVAKAVVALDGVYLDLTIVPSQGDPAPWFVTRIYPRARETGRR